LVEPLNALEHQDPLLISKIGPGNHRFSQALEIYEVGL